MTDVTTIGTGAAQVRLVGLRKTLRALEAAGADAQAMRDGMHRIGQVVVDLATPRVPKVSGRSVATLRAGRGKTKAVVRMGGARAPYAPVWHYGWPARGIKPNPVLVQTFQSSQGQLLAQLDTELQTILRDNNLA